MRKKFANLMANNCLANENESILVALSGGADSVALLHLLNSCGYNSVAAHCNFALRGAESDADEAFVRELCSKWGITLMVKRFDTTEHAARNKISIEMAARELRYEWFNKIAEEKGIQLIATGHSGDDAIETFFLNLSRGTGLKGLAGIQWREKNLIRPLLFASSKEIRRYCENNSLTYRIDSTNNDTKFLRNKVRHEIVPLFKELNPSFFDTMQSNMEHLREALEIFSNEAERVKSFVTTQCNDTLLIPVNKIINHPQKRSILYEILKPYGFAPKISNSVVNALNGTPGRQFLSNSYRLVIDRVNLILTPRGEKNLNLYTIEDGQASITSPLEINIRVFEREAGFKLSREAHIMQVDANLVNFPLTIRHALPGDRFQPLGMERFKKISDFYVDEKLSIPEKESCWLLLNGTDIIWVIGRRIDNRFKVTPSTTRILEISVGKY